MPRTRGTEGEGSWIPAKHAYYFLIFFRIFRVSFLHSSAQVCSSSARQVESSRVACGWFGLLQRFSGSWRTNCFRKYFSHPNNFTVACYFFHFTIFVSSLLHSTLLHSPLHTAISHSTQKVKCICIVPQMISYLDLLSHLIRRDANYNNYNSYSNYSIPLRFA